MTPALRVEGVVTSFADGAGGRIAALDGVDAVFQPGEFSAIVGASGSGKSTLLHALAGIVVPQAGRIVFGGQVLGSLAESARDAWRLAHCGMVFQDFRLIDELDALSNVLLPAHFAHWRIPADLRDRAATLLQNVGLPPRRGPVARLSRGEQQRVAMARALLLDPPVLLADEPTASLDAASGERIVDELEALARQGKIVISVTHDERLARRADQVLTLQAGRLSTTPSRLA